MPFAYGGVLLERERELETLRDGVDRACAGEGTLLLIEGPAGAGKTVLAREARAAAERARMMPLQARGSELEQPFAFGVVRQLLEPVISKEPGQSDLFAGAAGPAATELARAVAVLGDDSEPLLAGQMSGLSQDHAREAADDLVRADIFIPAERLGFVHPIVRAACTYSRLRVASVSPRVMRAYGIHPTSPTAI